MGYEVFGKDRAHGGAVAQAADDLQLAAQEDGSLLHSDCSHPHLAGLMNINAATVISDHYS